MLIFAFVMNLLLMASMSRLDVIYVEILKKVILNTDCVSLSHFRLNLSVI